MRETCTSGSEGGAAARGSPYPYQGEPVQRLRCLTVCRRGGIRDRAVRGGAQGVERVGGGSVHGQSPGSTHRDLGGYDDLSDANISRRRMALMRD
jgi:hypothetical protein